MKSVIGRLVGAAACLALFLSFAVAEESGEKEAETETETEEMERPEALAFVDIGNSDEGSIPGGTTVKEGRWRVDDETDELRALTSPLVISWLEFGPEVREKGATIVATGQAPGGGRLQSRFGVGLHGKNGFQLRLAPVKDEVELVRRREVLRSVTLPLETDRAYTMELAVVADDDRWIVRGWVWEAEEKRPDNPLIEYRIFDEELLFPLAGRAVLRATPFSGKPVAFTAAHLYPEEKKEEAEENSGESE